MTHRPLVAALGALALCTLTPRHADAQGSLTSAGLSYDFASFDASGFAPTPSAGQLDSDEWIATRVNALDLAFGGTSVDMDFANGVSTGGETNGGIYAFTPVTTACASAPRTLLGVQPSNRTFTPGSFQLRVTNATGAPLTELWLGYTLAYLNDADRSMLHTVDVLAVDGTGAETGRVSVAALAFETPVAATPGAAWESLCQGARVDLSSIPIAAGADLVVVFGFDDGAGSGSRDELGITDVRLDTMAPPDGGVPTIDAGPMTDGGASDAGPIADGGASDAGASVDGGGEDAGAGFDGGASDAGASPGDAATSMDSGAAPIDAASGVDAGTGGSEDGCGCSTPGRPGRAPVGAVLLALGAVALRRRRRAG